MDHQIEHHPDVGTAEGIRRQAVRFDEARLNPEFARATHGGVEALDVTHADHGSARLRRSKDALAGLGIGRHRLFDQTGLAGRQEGLGANLVHHRRRGDHREVDLRSNRADLGLPATPIALGDLLTALGVGIDHRNQFDARQFSKNARVVTAEVPDPNHAGAEFRGSIAHRNSQTSGCGGRRNASR